MKKTILALSSFLPLSILAAPEAIQNAPEPEREIITAKPETLQPKLPDLTSQKAQAEAQQIDLSDEALQNNPQLTEMLLNKSIDANRPDLIEKLVKIYRTFPQKDEILVKFADAKIAKNKRDYDTSIRLYREILAQRPELTPVRVELAMTLFTDQQDNAAEEQFNKAASASELPTDIAQLIQLYQRSLKQRGGWQFSLSARYLNEENVNNVSDSKHIDGVSFLGLGKDQPGSVIKGEQMLPQKAHGIGYVVGLERDFNLKDSHYLHFENSLYGKSYWDNHDYDDITNRTYLGYTNKSATQRWSVLPFYERQWYGGHRYKWGQGVRGEYNRWLTPNWQISTALEYTKQKYHQNASLDGHNKLASATLLWNRTPQQMFYAGIDYTMERTQARHYSYDLKSARIGWGQEWNWGISSRLSFSAGKREYKDNLNLGPVIRVVNPRPREDKIYNANLTLWKRDWHLWGITPKLNLNWRKQDSNFASLYSYTDKSANILLEKTF